MQSLTVPSNDKGPKNLELVVPTVLRGPARQTTDQEDPSTPLYQFFSILKRNWKSLLAFVTISLVATTVVSRRLTPIYESTATVDVDMQMPTAIIGQDSMRSTLGNSDEFLSTQIELIKSDSVLRPVAQQFGLGKPAKPNPDAGAQSLAEDAPVILQDLHVVHPASTYLLRISYRSTDPRLAAAVANAVANSYVDHHYKIRFRSSANLSAFMEKQIEELRAKMEQSSTALARFERDMNVINPEEKTSILSARLLQLNTDYTNAQSDRVKKEAAFSSVQTGGLEAAQVSSQGDAIRRLSERLEEAQEKFEQVKNHFGDSHPEYRKAAAQIAVLQTQLDTLRKSITRRVEIEYHESIDREQMLKKAVAEAKGEFDKVNARSVEYQALKREADADKKLYDELVQKIKESGINAGFQNSAIRLTDPARPNPAMVYPNIKLNLSLAFVVSLLIGIAVCVMADMFDQTIRDPEQVERLLKTQVVGTLPMVKGWKSRLLGREGEKENAPSQSLMRTGGDSERKPDHVSMAFGSAVRTLRNSILLGSFGRNLKSIMVTSALPMEGKTTTAIHLAIAHAQENQKTLLIDADLRRPGIDKKLNIRVDVGLAGILKDHLDWKDKLVKLPDVPDLDILPAGPTTWRSADKVGKALLPIIEEAAAIYDLIIIDTPPMLGFPEPLQIATIVDGVLLIACAGQTSRKAVGSAVTALERLRANTIGLVLNEVTKDMSDNYHYYGYYGNYYRYYRAASNE